MLPRRWNQPPCMNIEVKTVTQFGSLLTTQETPGASGTRVPGAT